VRVLLDTNVLISAVLFGGLPRELVRRVLRGEFEVVTSARLMVEFEEILSERFGMPSAVAQAARAEYELIAVVVRPRHVPRVARDPDDDEVLAAAVAGDCALVVTGDRDLLVLGSHEGRPILTPREFDEKIAKGRS
jgi:putative PIN family toxin of toxin-antitoxin system